MPRIEFSQGIVSNTSAALTRIGVGSSMAEASLFSAGGSANYPLGRICIMKGTMPTDTSSLTTYPARSADILVTFDGANGGVQAGVTSLNNVTTVALPYTNATASGQATWFWWLVKGGTTVSSGDAIYHSIIGSIGTLGSGADLEVNDVNVVQGSPYRITNLRITWPTTLDW